MKPIIILYLILCAIAWLTLPVHADTTNCTWNGSTWSCPEQDNCWMNGASLQCYSYSSKPIPAWQYDDNGDLK